MPRDVLYLNDLKLKNIKPDSNGGHVVYKNVLHKNKKRYFYKTNKHQEAMYSRFEVAFSSIARRFIAPNLTANQYLVCEEAEALQFKNQRSETRNQFINVARQSITQEPKLANPVKMKGQRDSLLIPFNTQKVTGVASEGLVYAIKAQCERENGENHKSQAFYFIDVQKKGFTFSVQNIDLQTPENIPLFFLKDFADKDLLHFLWQEKQAGRCTIDMDSLANILTSSYTLEEDDLHKGNIAFYIIQKDGKPHVVFQKIDHDLMFADSIMSRLDARVANWHYTNDSFTITAEDLRNFPVLKNSHNHYWPTHQRYLCKPRAKKHYNKNDVRNFSQFSQDPDFQMAKWRCFYKHILIPSSLTQYDLQSAYDEHNSAERSRIALISQALVSRQAHLRAVLFSMPEFRDSIKNMDENAKTKLIQEILQDVKEPNRRHFEEEIRTEMAKHQQLLEENTFVEGDTPLHVAIRLGDYRYEETLEHFKADIHVKNSRGENPLDLALCRKNKQACTSDIRSNFIAIAKHLLQQNYFKCCFDDLTDDEQAVLNSKINHACFQKVKDIKDTGGLIRLIRDLGEDHRYSLKMKKEISIELLQRFIQESKLPRNQLKTILGDFKKALNGTNQTKKIMPALYFLHQLRSRLWIVRIFRGLFGNTTTTDKLNTLLNQEIKRLTPQPSCCGFFADSNSIETHTSQPSPVTAQLN